MPNYIRSFRPWLAAATAAAFAACGGSDLTLPRESVAAKIVIVSGDGQIATSGGTLPEKLVVRVTDTKDRPVEGQQVTFTPADAKSGAAVPPSATTNADGKAEVTWVLGSLAGSQSMVAKPTGDGAPANLSVTFKATASTSAPAKLQKVSGDQQTATAGTQVAVAPSVKVTDAKGNELAGVLVTFKVASGGGTIAPTDPVPTNANGVAALMSWTLGATAGANSLTATISGTGITGNPATFTATGVVGTSNKLVFITQPSVTTTGAVIAPAVRVQVQDAAGNPIGNSTNHITLVLGNNPTGATLGGTTTVAAVGGIATFSNLRVNTAGTGYTLSAFASGLVSGQSQAFDVSAATPTQIAPNSAQSQTAGAGSNVPAPPSVIVKDAGGNGVPNVNVTFTITQGAGTTVPASPATVATNASGVASLTNWTVGQGANQVMATAEGVPGSVVFNATGTAGLSISTSSPLPNGEAGVSYTDGALSVSGGVAPFVWTLNSGSLPQGLTLNTVTGAITGTPKTGAVGTATFRIKVTDALLATATKDFQLTVVPAIQLTTASLPGATSGAPYAQTITVTGGQGVLTFTKQGDGTPAPGLTLNASTGVISGTPTAAGTFNFIIRVADELGGTDTQGLSIVVASALSITTPGALPDGRVDLAYSTSVAKTGGTQPITWTVSSGTLPAGLELSAGATISGTPTAAGTSTFDLQAQDAAGAVVSKTFTLTIKPAPLTIETASLPSGQAGKAYPTTSLIASGGTGSYTWTLAVGTLPDGLTLSTTGQIAGEPTTAGTTQFTVEVSDGSQTATRDLSITVDQ